MNPAYEVRLFWREEDAAVLAEVPALPGCMADGPTYQEVLANVETVRIKWFETAHSLGRLIPSPTFCHHLEHND